MIIYGLLLCLLILLVLYYLNYISNKVLYIILGCFVLGIIGLSVRYAIMYYCITTSFPLLWYVVINVYQYIFVLFIALLTTFMLKRSKKLT